MAMAHWELHAWVLILLARLLRAVLLQVRRARRSPNSSSGVSTPARARILSVVSLVAYVFTKVSVTVFAGAIVFQALLPDTFGSPDNAFWVGAFTTVILTGIYTVFGGMRAIMATAAPQAVIILFGSLVITLLGCRARRRRRRGRGLGRARRDRARQRRAVRAVAAAQRSRFSVARRLIASPIIGIWYWCTDQYIVQRTLSAKDLTTARRGALFGGLLKVWPVLIFLFPGMIGWALHQKGLIALPTKMVDGVA